jgi:hypothetical protein
MAPPAEGHERPPLGAIGSRVRCERIGRWCRAHLAAADVSRHFPAALMQRVER